MPSFDDIIKTLQEAAREGREPPRQRPRPAAQRPPPPPNYELSLDDEDDVNNDPPVSAQGRTAANEEGRLSRRQVARDQLAMDRNRSAAVQYDAARVTATTKRDAARAARSIDDEADAAYAIADAGDTAAQPTIEGARMLHLLGNHQAFREALILQELLAPPLSIRQHRRQR